MVELLLGGQGKQDFMRFKKAVTKGLVASDSTASIVAPRGITEDSFKYQVNYLRQNLRKPVGVTARACAGRAQGGSRRSATIWSISRDRTQMSL